MSTLESQLNDRDIRITKAVEILSREDHVKNKKVIQLLTGHENQVPDTLYPVVRRILWLHEDKFEHFFIFFAISMWGFYIFSLATIWWYLVPLVIAFSLFDEFVNQRGKSEWKDCVASVIGLFVAVLLWILVT